MGQVQNGHLYIRYRTTPPPPPKAEECKKPTDYISRLFNCWIYSISSANFYTCNKVKKTKCGEVNFVHLLSSSFFSEKHSSKTIWHMRILHIPNDCSTTGCLPFLFWGGVWAMTGELRPETIPQYPRRSCSSTSVASVYVFWVWHVQSGHEFASRQLSVSRSLTIVFSIYLVLKTNLVPWKTPLCI